MTIRGWIWYVLWRGTPWWILAGQSAAEMVYFCYLGHLAAVCGSAGVIMYGVLRNSRNSLFLDGEKENASLSVNNVLKYNFMKE